MVAHASFEIERRAIASRRTFLLARYLEKHRLRSFPGIVRLIAIAQTSYSRVQDLEMAGDGQDEHRADGVGADACEADVRHAAQLHSVHHLVVRCPVDLDRTRVGQGSAGGRVRLLVPPDEETRDGVGENGEGAAEQVVIGETARGRHAIAHAPLLARAQRQPKLLADPQHPAESATRQQENREPRLSAHEGQYHRERLHPGVEVHGVQDELAGVQERVGQQTTGSDRAHDVLQVSRARVSGHDAGEAEQRDVHADDISERFARRHFTSCRAVEVDKRWSRPTDR